MANIGTLGESLMPQATDVWEKYKANAPLQNFFTQLGVNLLAGQNVGQAVGGGVGAMGRYAQLQRELEQQQVVNDREERRLQMEQERVDISRQGEENVQKRFETTEERQKREFGTTEERAGRTLDETIRNNKAVNDLTARGYTLEQARNKVAADEAAARIDTGKRTATTGEGQLTLERDKFVDAQTHRTAAEDPEAKMNLDGMKEQRELWAASNSNLEFDDWMAGRGYQSPYPSKPGAWKPPVVGEPTPPPELVQMLVDTKRLKPALFATRLAEFKARYPNYRLPPGVEEGVGTMPTTTPEETILDPVAREKKGGMLR